MSKKEPKAAKDAKAEAPAKEGEGAAQPAAAVDENAAGKKKKKLILIAGIGGMAMAAVGGGGFFVMKTLGGKKQDLAAQKLDENGAEAKKEGDEAPGAAQSEENSDAKPDETGAAKPGDQGAAKPGEQGAAKPDENGKPAGKKGDSEENSFGETFDLPRMELNLGNPLENRFLKVGLSLEFHGGEEQSKALEKRLPQIRDIVITLIARKTRMELLTHEGKENFRKQLKNTFNEVLEKPVTNVYFTEFLVE